MERYISSPQLDPYAKLIGKVNLAASLVAIRSRSDAQNLLQECLIEAKPYPLLRGNLFEISAQNGIFHGDFNRARNDLEKSSALLKSAGTLDSFFVDKWLAVLTSLEDPTEVAMLHDLRVKAIEHSHWESIRECDFYIGLAGSNEALLQHCYFGTPFPDYRARIQNEAGLNPPAFYDWTPGEPSKLNKLQKGESLGPNLHLNDLTDRFKPGLLMHRLLQVLASDFYKPHHWISLHSQIFPDRFLSPTSSPITIRQIIKRTRQWLAQEHPDIEIQENRSRYSLCSRNGTQIRVGLMRSERRQEFYLALWKKHGAQKLSVSEAQKLWNVERHTAIRIFNELITEKLVERIGKGPATYYRPVETEPYKKRL